MGNDMSELLDKLAKRTDIFRVYFMVEHDEHGPAKLVIDQSDTWEGYVLDDGTAGWNNNDEAAGAASDVLDEWLKRVGLFSATFPLRSVCDHAGCDTPAIAAYTPEDDPNTKEYACQEHITDAGFANYAQWVAYRKEAS